MILFAGAALLIAVFFIITQRKGENSENKPETPQTGEIRITNLAEGSVKAIELKGEQDSLSIIRHDGKWVVNPEPLFTVLSTAMEEIDRTIRTLSAERIIEDAGQDLAPYGLTPPRVSVHAELADGADLNLYLGDPTPSKQAYYLKKEGDSRVYTIRAYKAEPFFYSVNDLRPDRLTPIDKEKITYIYMNNGREIELIPRDSDQYKLVAPFSAFIMTKPWRKPRGTDGEKLEALFQAIPFTLRIENFVDDNPKDLSPYGLAPPAAQLILKDQNATLHLLVGSTDGKGNAYVMESGSESVVAVAAESLSFLESTPFSLMDKFALIIDIDYVDRLVFSMGGRQTVAEIRRQQGAGENEETGTEYFIKGEPIQEKPFKSYYQKFIGLLLEAEHPEPGGSAEGKAPVITIAYDLNIPEKHAEISFFDFNRDFYEVSTSGGIEFLISKAQVEKAVAEAMELVE